MRFEMKMPDLAATESEIRIVRWLIEPGERIERGRAILEVETDKATMEVESVVSGVLAEVRARADETVSVGQVIAWFEVEGTTPTILAAPVQPKAAQAPATPSPVSAAAPVPMAGRSGGMFARNRAASASAPVPASGDIPLTVAQRTAGRRLQESKQTIPHFYLQTSVNASAILARRQAAEPVRLAWDAFFVRAIARAIGRFERFRCRIAEDRLVASGTNAIGVAVDHEGELYVLPIDAPAAKTVEQISDEIHRGVERLRGGDPEARRIRPALMTISNLGMTGVERFLPIINPPEPAILGIGRAMLAPIVKDDGQIGVEPRMALTLCVDHRVASGRYAGEFLAAIVKELESVEA
jgi:pyruvate dehydrogenase E2 component (dihydrolipoamide acetyltransferase)